MKFSENIESLRNFTVTFHFTITIALQLYKRFYFF